MLKLDYTESCGKPLIDSKPFLDGKETSASRIHMQFKHTRNYIRR